VVFIIFVRFITNWCIQKYRSVHRLYIRIINFQWLLFKRLFVLFSTNVCVFYRKNNFIIFFWYWILTELFFFLSLTRVYLITKTKGHCSKNFMTSSFQSIKTISRCLVIWSSKISENYQIIWLKFSLKKVLKNFFVINAVKLWN